MRSIFGEGEASAKSGSEPHSCPPSRKAIGAGSPIAAAPNTERQPMGTINAIDAIDAATLSIERLDAIGLLLNELETWLSATSRLMKDNPMFELVSREPELTIMLVGDEITLIKESMRSLLDTANDAK